MNPVPAQAIANIPRKGCCRQTSVGICHFKITPCLGDFCFSNSECPRSSVCCGRSCVPGKSCIGRSCVLQSDCGFDESCCNVFTGKIVMVKAVLMTLTALVAKRAVVTSVQTARIASVGPVRRKAIVKLQKAVVQGLVKVQIAIYTSS